MVEQGYAIRPFGFLGDTYRVDRTGYEYFRAAWGSSIATILFVALVAGLLEIGPSTGGLLVGIGLIGLAITIRFLALSMRHSIAN